MRAQYAMTRLVLPCSLALLAGAIWARSAAAEPWPATPSRALATQAEITVLARPGALIPIQAMGRSRGRDQAFLITEVLRGTGVKTGQTIVVGGLEQYTPKATDGLGGVILFLGPAVRPKHKRRGVRWRLLSSGMRGGNAQGHLCVPTQVSIPGSYRLLAPRHRQLPTAWADYVDRVRADLKVLKPLHAARSSPDARVRAQGVLAWLRAQRKDLRAPGASTNQGPRKPGWLPALPSAMAWLVEDGTPSQIMVGLDFSWGSGQTPWTSPPPTTGQALRSVEGRGLLMELVAATQQPQAKRLGALQLLARHDMFSGPRGEARGQALTPDEKHRYIPMLVSVMQEDAAFRLPAAKALAAIQRVVGGAISLRRHKVLEALSETYRVIEDAREKREFGRLVARIGGKALLTKLEAEGAAADEEDDG